MFEPLLCRILELGGDNAGLGKSEGSSGAAEPVRVAAQRLDRLGVVAGRYQPFGQLGDCAQLVTGSLQVLVSYSGREPEVVDSPLLAHGVQDIASLFFDLMTEHAVGLCATCRWVRIVTTRRGSVFYRCLRADDDPRDRKSVV